MPRLHASAFSVLCALAITASAQDPAPYTLHVYERLVQVPVLVIGSDVQPQPPADPRRFNISLDSGPRFHPNRVRMEGDDPIALTIVLDVSGTQADVINALSRNFTHWLGTSFKPQDRISIYALDCHLIRSADNQPPDPTARLGDLDSARLSASTHSPDRKSGCANTLQLWDSLAAIMHQVSTQPGRRVLLLFSAGRDGGSRLHDTDVRLAAVSSGIAVFDFSESSAFRNGDRGLDLLCARSGGIDGAADVFSLPRQLSTFVDTLRKRYILEFPTPVNSSGGLHNIDIEVTHSDATVRSTGVTVPIPDPAIAADPSTLPNTNTDAPQLGSHRPPQH